MDWLDPSVCHSACLPVTNSVSLKTFVVFSLKQSTVGFHYNMVKFDMIMHTSLQLPRQDVNQCEPTKTYLALMGELWDVFCENFQDRVITAPHCIQCLGPNMCNGHNSLLSCLFLVKGLSPSELEPTQVCKETYAKITSMIFCLRLLSDKFFVIMPSVAIKLQIWMCGSDWLIPCLTTLLNKVLRCCMAGYRSIFRMVISPNGQ